MLHGAGGCGRSNAGGGLRRARAGRAPAWDTSVSPAKQPCRQRVHPQRRQRQAPVLPRRPGYLRGLVGHHHALPSRHGVVHVLGEVVAFHADEVAGGG